MSDYTLYQGDCLDFMRGMDAGSVDAVFSDPPFNVGVKYGGKSSNDRREDYQEWCAAWISECFRILKDTGTFYLMTITRHLENLYPEMKKHGVFINQVNWKNVASANSGRAFWNEYQPILVYGKTESYIFNRLAQTRKTLLPWSAERKENVKGQLLDYWNDIPYVYGGSVHHKEAIFINGTNSKAHPAQMPIGLAARCIEFSSNQGATIFDPFMGSGTTGVACMQLGRNFIGCEIDAGYFAIAEKRICEAAAQPALFHLDGPRIEAIQAAML